MAERKHRSLKATKSNHDLSLLMNVKGINKTHAILHAKETGDIQWPLTKLPPNIQIGDTINLGVPEKSQPLTKETHLETLRALLEELVG